MSCEHDDLQDLQDDGGQEKDDDESTTPISRKQRRSMPIPRLWLGGGSHGDDYDNDYENEEKEEERTAVSTLLLPPPSAPVALPAPPFTVEGGNLFDDLMDMFSDEVDTKVGMRKTIIYLIRERERERERSVFCSKLSTTATVFVGSGRT